MNFTESKNNEEKSFNLSSQRFSFQTKGDGENVF